MSIDFIGFAPKLRQDTRGSYFPKNRPYGRCEEKDIAISKNILTKPHFLAKSTLTKENYGYHTHIQLFLFFLFYWEVQHAVVCGNARTLEQKKRSTHSAFFLP